MEASLNQKEAITREIEALIGERLEFERIGMITEFEVVYSAHRFRNCTV